MPELSLYSALASVASITTGVQVTITVPLAIFAWREKQRWEKLPTQTQKEARTRFRAEGVAALAGIVAVGLVNGSALAGWVLVIVPELPLVLPAVGVVAAGLGTAVCGIALSLWLLRAVW